MGSTFCVLFYAKESVLSPEPLRVPRLERNEDARLMNNCLSGKSVAVSRTPATVVAGGTGIWKILKRTFFTRTKDTAICFPQSCHAPQLNWTKAPLCMLCVTINKFPVIAWLGD